MCLGQTNCHMITQISPWHFYWGGIPSYLSNGLTLYIYAEQAVAKLNRYFYIAVSSVLCRPICAYYRYVQL